MDFGRGISKDVACAKGVIGMLCGFLSPDGLYTECENFEHLYVAEQICESLGVKKDNGMAAEYYLYSIGYVEFTARAVDFRFFIGEVNHPLNLLSDKQINFLIGHLEDANNEQQKNKIMMLLEENDAIKNKPVLHILDNRK